MRLNIFNRPHRAGPDTAHSWNNTDYLVKSSNDLGLVAGYKGNDK